MVSVLSLVPNAIRAGLAWDRARQLAMVGRHAEALTEIEQLPAYVTKTLRWSLLRIQQLYCLGRDAEVVSAAPLLRDGISKERGLSPNVRAYVLAYADVLRRAAPNYDSIDLAKVPSFWRANFPLRGHPNWIEETL
jgi:hypothetical protein